MKYLKAENTIADLNTHFETNEVERGIGFATEEERVLIYKYEPYALKFIANGQQEVSLIYEIIDGVNYYFEYSYDGKNWIEWEIDHEEEDVDDEGVFYAFLNVVGFGTQEHPYIYVRGYNPTGFLQYGANFAFNPNEWRV